MAFVLLSLSHSLDIRISRSVLFHEILKISFFLTAEQHSIVYIPHFPYAVICPQTFRLILFPCYPQRNRNYHNVKVIVWLDIESLGYIFQNSIT